jgi:catechol 2,3-dioxygenase-like lactoylglutathione lyase family enzyme
MPQERKARAIGFNHIALEVGDIDEALAFYGRLFDFELRGKSKTSAFIDLGDQLRWKSRSRGGRPTAGRWPYRAHPTPRRFAPSIRPDLISGRDKGSHHFGLLALVRQRSSSLYPGIPQWGC